ncbi:hypothetical protein [Aeromonas dhakensis]|uniref:hypothetical protein n=1 Tax=Aeromonas dhakensis TaxID=196024 RepID=UPI003EC7A741
MGKKSEARERKKALAQEKFEANKAAFIAKVSNDHQPRVSAEPAQEKAPRLAPHLLRAAEQAKKEPKAILNGSRFSYLVTWCDTKADLVGSWSWGELRAWQQSEWDQIIGPPFEQFRKLTWREIDELSSDTGHKMHHGHDVGDLIVEAQERWLDLNLEEYESVFRFRIGNTGRVWGFIVQAHFHIVWWDREHSIYPTEQK